MSQAALRMKPTASNQPWGQRFQELWTRALGLQAGLTLKARMGQPWLGPVCVVGAWSCRLWCSRDWTLEYNYL